MLIMFFLLTSRKISTVVYMIDLRNRMLVYKIMRKLGLQKLLYNLLYPFCKKRVEIDGEALASSLRRLDSYYPDKGGTSIKETEQPLREKAEYDLQIIVPAYNVEKYIRECIDSILSQQTRYSFVVTVVNDGSTDNTAEILKEYETVGNVIVINQENRGLSGARNRALENILGEYVAFVDSDDCLPQGTVEALLSAARRTDADIAEGGYSSFNENGITYTATHNDNDDADRKELFGFCCGKIFRPHLFRKVHFPPDYLFEDSICIYLIYPQCRKITTIKDIVYLYRINECGITNSSRKERRLMDALWVTRRMLEDSVRCNIPAKEIYDAFLIDMRVNYSRFASAGDETLHKDVFIASIDLMRKYFPEEKSSDRSLQALEKSFREADYGAYCLYGRCYTCV